MAASARFQKTYKWKEKIRQRPAMYIGGLRLRGFKQMLEYFFAEILSDCFENPTFEISFFSREKIMIKISNIDTRKFILRLDDLETADDGASSYGVGVFMTLSSDFSMTVNDHPNSIVLHGQRGDFETDTTPSQEEEKSIIVSYTADKEIFNDLEFVYDHFNTFLRQFAFLNPGLKIISIDNTTDELQRNVFNYPTGVLGELDYYIAQQPFGDPLLRIEINAKVGEYSYKVGISYSNVWIDKSFFKTYAGNVETYLGGSFDEGILEGIISAIRHVARKENADVLISRKLAKEQLTVVAAVQGEDFEYEGSTKAELGMPKLKKDVKRLVHERMIDFFKSNPGAVKDILNKFQRR